MFTVINRYGDPVLSYTHTLLDAVKIQFIIIIFVQCFTTSIYEAIELAKSLDSNRIINN